MMTRSRHASVVPRAHPQGSKSLEAGGAPSPPISGASGLSRLGASARGGVDPGLLFASNQSQAETVATTTTAGLSTVNGTRPLMMMDQTAYQQAADGLGLGLGPFSPAEEAARAKSRRLVYMCGFCASLTSILLGYDVSKGGPFVIGLIDEEDGD